MTDFKNQCFVCCKTIDPTKCRKNKELNLPVCDACEGSDKEEEMVQNLTEGLADGFVCGCI